MLHSQLTGQILLSKETCDIFLYDYRKALIAATGGAIRLGTRIRVGHWEFILGKRKSDECPVVKHALFSGLN